MNKYIFDFWVFIERGLLVENRHPIFIAWIYDEIGYLRKLYDEFITWGGERIDDITWNSQTINLENQLILKFGEGIYIQNNFKPSPPIIAYPLTDTRNIIHYPLTSSKNVIAYPFETYDDTVKSFTVFVPDDLVFDQVKMEAIINKYKLMGTDYEIETYIP